MSDDANFPNPHSNKAATSLRLGFGLQFEQLYEQSGLEQLDEQFVHWLAQRDPSLAQALVAARSDGAACQNAARTQLLLALAPFLDDFLVELFGIKQGYAELQSQLEASRQILDTKKKFVLRKALRSISADEAKLLDGKQLAAKLRQAMQVLHTGNDDFDTQFSNAIQHWQEAHDDINLDTARQYAAWATLTSEGQHAHPDQIMFRQALGVDPQHRMRHASSTSIAGQASVHFVPITRRVERDGFSLTDRGKGLRFAQDQSLYCLWCHREERDSCRHGHVGSDAAQHTGCPLEQRISESLYLRGQHKTLGALAMICLDNPMLAATGHRICNDCVKACVFQKQDGVDIPQAETQTLRDVLALPWGVEIYSLLTRWNPLNVEQPVPLKLSGKCVLVAGQGPAGFTLAHHLLNLGHQVRAIDALRITPWRIPFQPVQFFAQLSQDLAEREQAGFGGVAEYGITVRWDKNFLSLVRLLLERRQHYSLSSSVRLGSNLSCMQAFDMGVDHIALALGAGKPGVINSAHSLAKGVRTASDFLMALQLTGAARETSLANVQIRLPIVVIGAGLSAVDAATEALAYYPVQVEKFARHYAQLPLEKRPKWTAEEALVAATFLEHADAIAREREAAAAQGRPVRLSQLLDQWGGCQIVYRKSIKSSPAYRLNHEELESALSEGVKMFDHLSPREFLVDEYGHVSALECQAPSGALQTVQARCVLLALGTTPNAQISEDEPGMFAMNGSFLQAYDLEGVPVEPAHAAPKAAQAHFTCSRIDAGPHAGKQISMFGDMHPGFAGNVVKAMASAKRGAPYIHAVLAKLPPKEDEQASSPLFLAALESRLLAVVQLAPGIVELVIHSPLAARNVQPGQFFRFQQASGPMEGVALTSASADAEQGLISLIVLDMGASTHLCTLLTPGEPIALMGPTGAPSDLPSHQTVLLAGGGLGNAVLFSIGQALKARNCRVLYFAAYKRAQDRFRQDSIEAASDVVVWCCENSTVLTKNPLRTQDMSVHGNILQAMAAYSRESASMIKLEQVQWMLAIGSDGMMAAIAKARQIGGEFHEQLGHCAQALASINSPMQCMMKQVCGQCLQRQVDPLTGVSKIVFSCRTQDQPMDAVDWASLHDRLTQDSTLAKLSRARVARSD